MQKSRFVIFFFIPKNSLNIFCACLYRLLGTTFNLVHYTHTYMFFPALAWLLRGGILMGVLDKQPQALERSRKGPESL